MRNFVRASIFIVFLGATQLYAQDKSSAYHASRVDETGSYAIHGSDLLWKREAELRAYLAVHPEADLRKQLKKQSAWGFTVGSTKSWYATDLSSSTEYLVPSTCRAVGTNCYVFVADDQWGTRANQAVVDSVRNAFDLRTPANPNKGIYQTDVEAFGNPPDVDGDPRIIILLLDIKDGYAGSGGYVAGYFSSLNEMDRPGSNKAEVYYLDSNPGTLTTSSGLQSGLSTTAHEFQHMIHYNYDSGELAFINEGCSLLAEVNAGYSLYSPSLYVNETNHSLLDWRYNDNTGVLSDYSRAARFMLYLRDQFGIGFFKQLVATNFSGISGITYAMQQAGITLTFSDLVQNFMIANNVNDRSIDTKYGYLYTPMIKCVGTMYNVPSYSTVGEPDVIQPYAAMYLDFKAGTDLKALFTADAGLVIKAIETGAGTKRIVDVTSGTQFSEPAFGSTYSEVVFVVLNREGVQHRVTSSITGKGGASATEIKYEISEPTGYLSNADGDTVCVTFDGISGGRLDSVKIAFRRPGSMTGGIWNLGTAGKPLGTPIAVPLTATSTMAAPTVPYPVPWPSWATLDVRSKNIDASKSFAVALRSEGVYTAMPRVMVSKYASSNSYHSFTYQTAATTPGWYYLSATQEPDSIWLYHIRAYVSFGTSTDVRKTVELLPSTTALAQNYPNPFNPSTTIKFTLSSKQFVSLKIYDILGKEVAVIAAEELPAGTYTRVWNAASMPSGVYFSTLRVGNTVETKRIVLEK